MSGLDLGFVARHGVRLIRQTEMAECGLASLAMIGNFHGHDIDLASLRLRFVPSARGATLKSMIGIADALGMTSRALKLPLEELPDLQMPAVLHWNMNHFVVVERFRRKRALIHDPAAGSAWYSMPQLSDHFTGVALEIEPGNDFTAHRMRQSMRLSQLWSRMSGFKRSVAQVLLLSLVLQLFVLALPYYMQVAIDSALPALDNDLLAVLALGFGLFTLVNAATSLLRGFILLNAGTRLGYGLAVNIARRLFRLPIDWFAKRSVGDVLSRFQSILPIKDMLTEGAAAAVIDGAFALLTLGFMLLYSPLLTLVVLIAFAAYALIRSLSYAAERRVGEASIILRGNEQTTLIETLRGMTTLRLFNREALRLSLWQSNLTSAVNADVQAERIGIWQKTGNALVFGFENIVTVWIAVGFAIDGGFTVGMVFAFMAYKVQFVDKAVSLIDKAVAFRMLGLHLERLSDIALTREDVGFHSPPQTPPALAQRAHHPQGYLLSVQPDRTTCARPYQSGDQAGGQCCHHRSVGWGQIDTRAHPPRSGGTGIGGHAHRWCARRPIWLSALSRSNRSRAAG